jgi:hypothetical protein
MAHIPEELFYQWVFDGSSASAAEGEHLEICPVCRTNYAAVQRLGQEVRIAQASTPSAAAIARYQQLYAQVTQAPSLVQRVTELITAHLQWDGRQQPTWQGVRNPQVTSYRLLYTTEQAEIELLIVPRAGSFQIEGEVMPLTEVTAVLPAWCEVTNAADGETLYAAESQPNGRFHLGDMPGGRYHLSFTTPTGPTLVINDLELRER